jgi:hypothetical protein
MTQNLTYIDVAKQLLKSLNTRDFDVYIEDFPQIQTTMIVYQFIDPRSSDVERIVISVTNTEIAVTYDDCEREVYNHTINRDDTVRRVALDVNNMSEFIRETTDRASEELEIANIVYDSSLTDEEQVNALFCI